MSFDTENPPNTFKKFRKDVLESLEEAEVELDKPYPIALFIVGRDKEGYILELSDLVTELDLDPETPMQFIMHYIYPAVTKKKGAKYFGIVFPGSQLEDMDDDEPREIMIALTGSMNDIDMVAAPVDRDEDYDLCSLEPWEKIDIEGFEEIIVPFRRSVTLQG